MKEYQLSTPRERYLSAAFTVAAAAVLIVLTYAMRSNIGLLIFCGMAAVLLVGLLCFYTFSAFRSRCIVDIEGKTLEVKGYPSYSVDLSDAVQLQALLRKNGQSTIRCLVFSDEEDNIVGVVPTLFTYKQGALAEPLAKQMAQDLGIAYKETTPAWEYDKEAFEEHRKQEEAEEKANREKRRKEKMERRMAKLKKKYQK